jgi:hypothetical protein
MTHAEIHLLAYRSIQTLEKRAQLVAQEHRERIKRLRSVMQSIAIESQRDELNVMAEAPTLAPDLHRILHDPTHGL